tara:strand:+ start:29076 stop:30353 length:1278 start_codon:yes stop_codon:yes gene_type:complete
MKMIELVQKLYPIHRSLTGNGVRESLKIIQGEIPIEIKEVPCGTQVLDWTIPPEWNIKEAFVRNQSTGEKVIDFSEHNLHIMGYSQPVNKVCDFDELSQHLYFLEDQPDAIPFVCSYYNERWGFCLTYNDFLKLDKEANYEVIIDCEHNPKGSLTYAEIILKGKSDKEVFFSTYICHPQMCNNELSGPALTTQLAKHIMEIDNYYSYRFILIPETIGSITYLAKNITHLKKKVKAGFNLSCVGDNRTYSYVPSRLGDNLSDKVAKFCLDNYVESYDSYTWLDRGSDERQYCAPGVDLPICSVTRSKYHTYPEYHTSLDNFDVVTEEGLQGAFSIYKKIIFVLENNFYPKVTVLGEPQLGKRGLFDAIVVKGSPKRIKNIKNFLAFSDGDHSILDISHKLDVDFAECAEIMDILEEKGLIEKISKD